MKAVPDKTELERKIIERIGFDEKLDGAKKEWDTAKAAFKQLESELGQFESVTMEELTKLDTAAALVKKTHDNYEEGVRQLAELDAYLANKLKVLSGKRLRYRHMVFKPGDRDVDITYILYSDEHGKIIVES
jgi:hypothetical protein